MLGVLSAMMWKTTAVVVAVSAPPLTGSAIAVEMDASCRANRNGGGASCANVGKGNVFASESLLLQRSSSRSSQDSMHLNAAADPSMVNDDTGFEGGDIDEIEDTGCQAADVRRRRRVDSCWCRRRDSGKRYDGGWVCQGDQMVQEPPQYANPIWAEEFEDERGDGSLNESRWEILYTGSGNGNNELQFYTKRLDNLKIDNGVLKIIGKPEQFEWKGYTSGKIQSRGKGDWGPGVRIEVRAKLPLGVGTWPAVWMMPTEYNYGGWPDCGEIDIMEAVGRTHGKVFGTIHTGAYNHMKGTHQGKSFYTDFSEWHTYALNWYEDRLEWYADGNLYNTFAPGNTDDYAKWPFNRRFYLILNLALGGNLGGPIRFGDEQIMEVDYARVYCLDGSTTCKTEKITCCDSCSGKKYCSQRSGNCYDEKRQDYYDTCDITPAPESVAPVPPAGSASPTPAPPAESMHTPPACCSGCGNETYCSPQSNQCYAWKKKDYYVRCFPAPEPVAPVPPAGSASPTPAPTAESMPTPSACCSGCGDEGYCSPQSNQCYAWKKKDYYVRCFTGLAACCSSCGGSGYCSPQSGQCYSSKSKDYYESCSCCSSCGSSGYCSPQSRQCYSSKSKDYYETCS